MNKVKIIAEIAQGYDGDFKLCSRFVELAKKSGADGIKFQIFEAEELCISNYKYYQLFKTLYIDPKKWRLIIDKCKDLDIEFYADVFGVKTLEWMLKCDISGIKIHSSDLKNVELLSVLKDKNIRIIIGAGGSTIEEIKKAVSILGRNEIIIMSGFQAEPNLIEDIELNKIQIIKEIVGCKVGYADHIEVSNPLSISLPSMSVLMGADFIEKHLTIDRDFLQLEDYTSALNPNEFLMMSKMVRDVENFPDPYNNKFLLSDRELQYRKSSKKVVLASSNLKSGKVLKNEDLVMLRTAEDCDEIIGMEELLGKQLKVEVQKHKIIKKEYLK